ncbi:MAG: cytochrome C biogenesis protein CcmB [Saprospiraceae bacterium]|nr:MAG: cytochrome C biogenesis protein CcmB [Saprospiraceae bacterium]
MGILRETGWLLQKEFLLEWRNKFALSGILLYVFSTIFIVYLAFFNVDPRTWNALFWIIVLFAAVNAAVKSFAQENSQRQLYYYTLVNPIAVILSKILYNIGLLFLISLLTWLGFGFVADNPVKDPGQFVLVIFLGSLGFAIAFTFISAISAKANNNATLMAIMSFPVIIPVLLTLIKLSANALRILQDTDIGTDITVLVSINMMLLGMALLLYPFLWRG